MKLILTEEEQFLKDTAKSFAEERSPITHFRSLRDMSDPMLWDKNIWNEMSKLGWPGIMIPEEFGGSNFGLSGICVVGHVEIMCSIFPRDLDGARSCVFGCTALHHFGFLATKN